MAGESMIERVARAIHEAGGESGTAWDDLPDEDTSFGIGKHCRRVEARAAIAAMREPTAEMIKAGRAERREWFEGRVAPEGHWQAMIDAALKGGE